jgi:hypothetical protein
MPTGNRPGPVRQPNQHGQQQQRQPQHKGGRRSVRVRGQVATAATEGRAFGVQIQTAVEVGVLVQHIDGAMRRQRAQQYQQPVAVEQQCRRGQRRSQGDGDQRQQQKRWAQGKQ